MLIEVWSDVVCPWCAIGRARLGRALEALEEDGAADDLEVRWRSFELDPHRAATTDVDYVTMLATKYRTSRDQAQAMIDRMTAAGAADGIEFHFEDARPGNTFDAHRVLHLAADRGVQDAVKARFLAGYHSEGEPIADHDVLTRLAGEAGLDTDEVATVLAGDAYADAVRADEQQAVAYGISGVPFFVFDRTVGVSGAQPPEVLRRAVEQTREHVLAEGGGGGGGGGGPADADDPNRDHDDHDGHAHAPGEACVDGVCAI